jgi:hypothetical protein
VAHFLAFFCQTACRAGPKQAGHGSAVRVHFPGFGRPESRKSLKSVVYDLVSNPGGPARQFRKREEKRGKTFEQQYCASRGAPFGQDQWSLMCFFGLILMHYLYALYRLSSFFLPSSFSSFFLPFFLSPGK